MKYAVISLGGKQFKVSEGDTLKLERQDGVSNEVLYYSDGESVQVGTPKLANISVKLTKTEDKKDKKVRVARFKSKSRYKKTKGHRQPISVLKVEKIFS